MQANSRDCVLGWCNSSNLLVVHLFDLLPYPVVLPILQNAKRRVQPVGSRFTRFLGEQAWQVGYHNNCQGGSTLGGRNDDRWVLVCVGGVSIDRKWIVGTVIAVANIRNDGQLSAGCFQGLMGDQRLDWVEQADTVGHGVLLQNLWVVLLMLVSESPQSQSIGPTAMTPDLVVMWASVIGVMGVAAIVFWGFSSSYDRR